MRRMLVEEYKRARLTQSMKKSFICNEQDLSFTVINKQKKGVS